MPNRLTIKLASSNLFLLNQYIETIKKICDRTRAKYSIVYLPTKKIRRSVRKAPNERGTKTFECWELRIHRRLIKIDGDDRTLHMITRIPISDELQLKISIE